MLPFVLVSLFVSSALALPSVQVSQYNINEIAPVKDNGALVSSFLTDRAFEIVDGGDTNIYILTIQQILNDLANQRDVYSQSLAVGQAIAVLGELATGIPGDACDAAAVINAVASGNGVRAAVNKYVKRLANNMDLIAQLATNPGSLRGASGPKGNCAGAGRSYQFEAAWNTILDGSHSYYLEEEYCAAKRLYNAFNSRSNNVGAAVTAASVGPVRQAFRQALNPVSSFLKAIANGVNPGSLTARAKNALIQAVAFVQY